MAVIRVTNPEAFDHPAIRDLFRRAIEANKVPHVEGTLFELKCRIGEPSLGVFVAAEEGRPVGVLVGMLPTSNFMLGPQVLAVYAEGKSRHADELVRAVQAWFEEHGFKYAISGNTSGYPDKVWLRAFKSAGKATFKGTAYEFRWE